MKHATRTTSFSRGLATKVLCVWGLTWLLGTRWIHEPWVLAQPWYSVLLAFGALTAPLSYLCGGRDVKHIRHAKTCTLLNANPSGEAQHQCFDRCCDIS
ncbi:hypothetical protein K439DRAFT_580009 [Ramaria rubella]|nr:hypothetical protein K439DRAFT_580009 [Ramaria rubella]